MLPIRPKAALDIAPLLSLPSDSRPTNMALELNEYFTDYGDAAFDAQRLATFYGEFAVASAPNFVGCLKGGKEIRESFQNIAENQKRTGLISMKPAHVDAVELD